MKESCRNTNRDSRLQTSNSSLNFGDGVNLKQRDIGHLLDGVYLYKVNDKEKEIGKGKIIKQ